MTTFTRSTAEDAALLLRYALQPTATPAHDPEYQRVCAEYESDALMQEMCGTVARGLGLSVLAVHPLYGAVLAPTASSPFAFEESTFVPGAQATVKARQVDGAILLAIIATAFPRRNTLAGDPSISLAPFSADHVVKTLGEAIARAAAATPAPQTPLPDADRPIWAILRSIPEVRETTEGRSTRGTRQARVERLLERLRDVGAVTRVEKSSGAILWQPTWRWQVQVAAFAQDGSVWESVAPAFWPTTL